MNPPDFDEVSAFEIDKLREDVASGIRPLRITSHAQIEAFKDGLLLKDLRYVFERGEIIELYRMIIVVCSILHCPSTIFRPISLLKIRWKKGLL